jgi:hypothetical protein
MARFASQQGQSGQHQYSHAGRICPLGRFQPSFPHHLRSTNIALKRFQAKWTPVRVKKTRQIKNLEPRFDSIETEKALACFPLDLRSAKWG